MSLRSLFVQPWFGPAVIALAAWLGIVAAIDPAGSYPNRPEGPGLTVDEMFNVEQGVYLVEAIRAYGPGILDPRSIREVFGQPPYLPDHPPLGRLWLGVHHHITWAIAPPVVGWIESSRPTNLGTNEVSLVQPRPFASGPVTACARTGSATAFALTIWLIGWFVGRSYGPWIGCLAAMLLPLTPRLWAHAHLASLETITNLTCTAAVLAVLAGWKKRGTAHEVDGPPSFRAALFAGIVLGLAFLTKIQAILLPIPILAWALWRWHWGALKPLAVWGLAAAVVFFVGWPWLWLDPVENLAAYFTRATARAELSVWYFGTQYGDRSVPWTYPWVMFLATLPMPVLVLGMRGVLFGLGEREPAGDIAWRALVAANVLFPLILFSIPGVAVYDGERLFLTAFPSWVMLAARGGQLLAERLSRRWVVAWLFSLMLGIQAWNVLEYRPCQLSFYNAIVGGPRGAEKLGLETTYWGDSLTRSLLSNIVELVPEGATVHVAPVLHPFQLEDLLRQSPILRGHRIRLEPYSGESNNAEYLLLYRRRADLPPELRFGPADAQLLAEVRRRGVQLSAFHRLASP
jgi:hypothetical protein